MADATSDTNERFEDGRLVELLHRYVDDSHNADELAELNELLRADSRARELFVRFMTQDACLYELLATDTAAAPIAPSAAGGPARRQAQSPGVVSPNSAPLPSPLPSPLPPRSSPSGPTLQAHSSSWLYSRGLLAGLGALTIVGVALIAFQAGRQHGANDTADNTFVPSTALAHAGRHSLKMESGTAVLSIANVGELIAEGPVEFDLLDPMRGRLRNGRIRFRVTNPAGIGFVVETPHGEVTDIGTEFGLDVNRGRDTQLVVFEGAVDLRVANERSSHDGRIEHLEAGEAIAFNRSGQLERISSICTGTAATFKTEGESNGKGSNALISSVSDNLRTADTKKFYEIVPGGLREDALAYADRPETEWNGATKEGMPSYLIGADYVKPFNNDKLRKDVKIKVTFARPAKLYIIYDKRLKVPDWLHDGFRDTSDVVGLDYGVWGGNRDKYARDVGPGVSIDAQYAVWERVVVEPGVVELGSNTGQDWHASTMYGIAAVALEPEKTNKSRPDKPRPDDGR